MACLRVRHHSRCSFINTLKDAMRTVSRCMQRHVCHLTPSSPIPSTSPAPLPPPLLIAAPRMMLLAALTTMLAWLSSWTVGSTAPSMWAWMSSGWQSGGSHWGWWPSSLHGTSEWVGGAGETGRMGVHAGGGVCPVTCQRARSVASVCGTHVCIEEFPVLL